MPTMDPFAVFAFYHLGLDEEFQYKFRNIHDTAKHFQVSEKAIRDFLEREKMTPERIRHTDFNLSEAHSEAMIMDMDGLSKDAKKAFAQQAFGKLRDSQHDSLREFDDVDYDNLLGLD